jgi:hypothetical protein
MKKMEKWFAWYPVTTTDGKIKWLTTVYRKWNWDLNPWAYDVYAGTDGGWDYFGVEE